MNCVHCQSNDNGKDNNHQSGQLNEKNAFDDSIIRQSLHQASLPQDG